MMSDGDVCAGALIEHKGRFLIVQSYHGNWGLPKGHLEPGERPVDAAVREVREEVGIDIDPLHPSFINAHYSYTMPNGVEKLVIVFYAKVDSPEVTIDGQEIRGYLWCELDEAREKLSFPNVKEALSQLLSARDAFIEKK